MERLAAIGLVPGGGRSSPLTVMRRPISWSGSDAGLAAAGLGEAEGLFCATAAGADTTVSDTATIAVVNIRWNEWSFIGFSGSKDAEINPFGFWQFRSASLGDAP